MKSKFVAALTCAFAVCSSTHAQTTKPDALLQIDLNRAAVVERIVEGWKGEIPAAQLTSFRNKLNALRVDHLLAANLSGSFEGVLEIVNRHEVSQQAPRAISRDADRSKAVGDPLQDLVYTPVTPCRLFDSRAGQASALGQLGGVMTAQSSRTLNAGGKCGIPATGVASIFLSFHAYNHTPAALGIISFLGPNTNLAGMAATWTGANWATGTFITETDASGTFNVFVGNPSPAMTADMVVDVAGYFMPSNRNGDGLRIVRVIDQKRGLLTTNVVNGDATNAITNVCPLVGLGTTCRPEPGTVPAGTISGGIENRVTDSFGTIGGGSSNRAGDGNEDPDSASGATVAGGIYNRASGNLSSVGGGQSNQANGPRSTISGGEGNIAVGDGSTISGGVLNKIESLGGTLGGVIGGGRVNVLDGSDGAILGGYGNKASSQASVAVAGWSNEATGELSVVVGGERNIAEGRGAAILGGSGNVASGHGSAVIAGGGNRAQGAGAIVAGGAENRISTEGGAILGGNGNSVLAVLGSIGGGYNNTVEGGYGAISGGIGNRAIGGSSGIGGGTSNYAYGSGSFVAGGMQNKSRGVFSFAAGGMDNASDGSFSFTAGRGASANDYRNLAVVHNGAFVWADSAGGTETSLVGTERFHSSAADQFAVRSRGGIVFRVAATDNADTGAGCALPAGGAASWSCSSDRNLKEAIQAISPQTMLNKVLALPVTSWQFIGTNRRHIGPMAQDFRAAFGLGADDKNITTSDVSGVALAAIQGLNQKLEAEKAKNKAKEVEIAALKADLALIKKKLGL